MISNNIVLNPVYKGHHTPINLPLKVRLWPWISAAIHFDREVCFCGGQWWLETTCHGMENNVFNDQPQMEMIDLTPVSQPSQPIPNSSCF